jgi:predicted glycogen debranching enzyme
MTQRVPVTAADNVTLLSREWLVTNGLGGYSSGTVLGPPTRRYHGLLIAALPAPLGRMVFVDGLSELIERDGGCLIDLTGSDPIDGLKPPEAPFTFALELGLPVWTYRIGGARLEKRIVMPHAQNTTHVTYRLLDGEEPLRLRLRPWLAFRGHEQAVRQGGERELHPFHCDEDRCEIRAAGDLPALRLSLHGGGPMVEAPRVVEGIRYRIEEERGCPHVGSRQSPGYYRVEVQPGKCVSLSASVEPWETVLALDPDEALDLENQRRERLIIAADETVRAVPAAELVLAADQFVITPVGRAAGAVHAHAAGDELRSVIAGYHWFTDWGRDTMISLEGLTLTTGRRGSAAAILLTFAHHVRDGLIPNLFPEGQDEGLYHTADASLWLFQAVERYRAWTNDTTTLQALLPTLIDIAEHHIRGTRFGIGVDPADGLLRQGAEGYQLTWMDAKVEGWVVTPRRGKAVEINALWYNALRLLEGWLRQWRTEDQAARIRSWADRAYRSFNERFWNEQTGCLFDVVDGESGGDDPAVRPNQVLAISLTHPVLDPKRWASVLSVVETKLLTPLGLRTLSPDHPDYQPYYMGDLRARDAAYHQGTVWPWLLGPFCDAWRRYRPQDVARLERLLTGLLAHLDEAGIGTISEIYDAEPPFHPRGCIAQAWSVAEVLRCLAELERARRRQAPPEAAGKPADQGEPR